VQPDPPANRSVPPPAAFSWSSVRVASQSQSQPEDERDEEDEEDEDEEDEEDEEEDEEDNVEVDGKDGVAKNDAAISSQGSFSPDADRGGNGADAFRPTTLVSPPVPSKAKAKMVSPFDFDG